MRSAITSFFGSLGLLALFLAPAAHGMMVQLHPDHTYTLEHNGFRINRLTAGIIDSAGVVRGVDYADARVTFEGQNTPEFTIKVIYSDPRFPELIVRFSSHSDGVVINATANASPNTPAHGLLPIVVLPGPQGPEADFTAFNRVYVNGYQSWSYTGWVDLNKTASHAKDLLSYQFWGNNNRYMYMDSHLSWWFSIFGGAPTTPRLFLGALSAEHFKTAMITLYDKKGKFQEFAVLNGAKDDPRQISPIKSEQILVGVPRSPAFLERYARLISGARETIHDATQLSGWNSWSSKFAKVTAADIESHAKVLAGELGDLPLKVLYVDDGWEKSWGDWYANTRFPGGMKYTADGIKAKGLVPGLWLAPFIADRNSPVFREHNKDWFVKDAKGQPMPYIMAPQLSFLPRNRFILDTTNPAVQGWLRDTFRRLYDEGYRVFKIDFLYGASYEGVRHSPATSLQAYRAGMKVIREALPADAKIIACGALPLPSVSYCDAYRIGPDVLHPVGFVRWPYIANALRNGFNLFHFHNTLFQNDPDTVIVREQLSPLQAQAALAGNVLSGGPLILGDDLVKLSKPRLDMFKAPWVREMLQDGSAPRPLDFEHSPNRRPYNTAVGPYLDFRGYSSDQPGVIVKKAGAVTYIGAFNWGRAARNRALDLSLLGLPREGEISEVFGKSFERSAGHLSFKSEGSSVHLFRVKAQDLALK